MRLLDCRFFMASKKIEEVEHEEFSRDPPEFQEQIVEVLKREYLFTKERLSLSPHRS